jgi:hypothetical protein
MVKLSIETPWSNPTAKVSCGAWSSVCKLLTRLPASLHPRIYTNPQLQPRSTVVLASIPN